MERTLENHGRLAVLLLHSSAERPDRGTLPSFRIRRASLSPQAAKQAAQVISRAISTQESELRPFHASYDYGIGALLADLYDFQVSGRRGRPTNPLSTGTVFIISYLLNQAAFLLGVYQFDEGGGPPARPDAIAMFKAR